MSVRRSSRKGFQSNPFVVLADITIALSIIFLVYGIATSVSNNQILMFFDRNRRQNEIETDLVKSITAAIPGSVAASVRSPGDTRDHIDIKRNGQLVATVWTNASFQRIQLLVPMFQPSSATLENDAGPVLAGISKVIEVHARQKAFSYLFFHGTTETSESLAMSREAAVELSQRRAESVLKSVRTDSDSKILGMEPRFVIPYGTGSDLYTVKGASAGRVDLLLFYNDITAQPGVR